MPNLDLMQEEPLKNPRPVSGQGGDFPNECVQTHPLLFLEPLITATVLDQDAGSFQ